MSRTFRARTTGDAIPLGAAVATWALGWVVGTGVLAGLAITAVGGELGEPLTPSSLLAGATAGWAAFLLALVVVSRRFGSGNLARDLAIGFRPVDLVGVPVGVFAQLVAVPALYWPLQRIWPDTFGREQIEERASELVDGANGIGLVAIVLVVAVGAPIVEELVYRGLLQRSAAAVIGPWPALVVVSLWFSLIHLSPVEYPGLFLAGLAFGAGLTLTGRLGPSIVTHATFNITGLVLVVG